MLVLLSSSPSHSTTLLIRQFYKYVWFLLPKSSHDGGHLFFFFLLFPEKSEKLTEEIILRRRRFTCCHSDDSIHERWNQVRLEHWKAQKKAWKEKSSAGRPRFLFILPLPSFGPLLRNLQKPFIDFWQMMQSFKNTSRPVSWRHVKVAQSTMANGWGRIYCNLIYGNKSNSV